MSISSTFFAQLLHIQIQKAQKRLTNWLSFCTFWIYYMPKRCSWNVGEIDTWSPKPWSGFVHMSGLTRQPGICKSRCKARKKVSWWCFLFWRFTNDGKIVWKSFKEDEMIKEQRLDWNTCKYLQISIIICLTPAFSLLC